ncbi:MAG: hypothetical protein A2Z83_02920 [Omnitrophica bacterium GWA2_52_8]|nr:MAG: hypothetical protein A2Z83_02920 [Omnitrophica bacterium GWA2_52_8]
MNRRIKFGIKIIKQQIGSIPHGADLLGGRLRMKPSERIILAADLAGIIFPLTIIPQKSDKELFGQAPKSSKFCP